MATERKIRFAAMGLNHGHINGQTQALLRAGAELVAVYAKEPDLVANYRKAFPQAKAVASEAEIFDDKSIDLVTSASIPNERGPLGVRVMQAGKDFLVDKPGMTTLEQLAEIRRVQAQTKRFYTVFFSERIESKVGNKAKQLVDAGAIGKVIQTSGFGPHRAGVQGRPPWFFKREQYGGILCDIASHQADQFLWFTGSAKAEVVASQVGNFNHPQYPELEDFGDVIWTGDGGTGYARVDWFTPKGLQTWGDGRMIVLGTDGYIEMRKYIDIAGRPGGNHLFLVNQDKTEYINCDNVELDFTHKYVRDIAERTETAMPQSHSFLAMELVLKAQAQARRIGR